MNAGNNNTRLNTIVGSIFTFIVIEPNTLMMIFITGAVGALGSYVATLAFKYIHAKLIKMKERIGKAWSK